jgi:hypothetical protein
LDTVTNGRGSTFRSLVRTVAVVLVVVAAAVLLENAFVPPYLTHLSRMTTDFSPAYLRQKLATLAAAPPQVVFLGDSAMWGYSLPSDKTAIAILTDRGCRCVNLAFKAGSPANYYALAKLFAVYGVRPKLVVLELNQRSLNPADQSYKSLHPGIAALAGPLLTTADRSTLAQAPPATGIAAQFDALLASTWALYAMRADLRALVLGDVDALPKQRATADQFLGTYDLSALDEHNVGVHYLEKTVETLQAQDIPVVAFLTPTNHALLHEYIDDPAYAANGAYLVRLLKKRGVRTIDLDRAFPTADFVDNAHLTERGQIRMADTLSHQIPELLPAGHALGQVRLH